MVLGDVASVVGYNYILVLLLFFSMAMFLISRFAGFTSIMVTFMLTVYFFATEKVDNTYLLSQDWLIATLIVFGLFLGFMVYMFFIKD